MAKGGACQRRAGSTGLPFTEHPVRLSGRMRHEHPCTAGLLASRVVAPCRLPRVESQWHPAGARRAQSRGRLWLSVPIWVADSKFPIWPRMLGTESGHHAPPIWPNARRRVNTDSDIPQGASGEGRALLPGPGFGNHAAGRHMNLPESAGSKACGIIPRLRFERDPADRPARASPFPDQTQPKGSPMLGPSPFSGRQRMISPPRRSGRS